jgi:hypothetical protein
MVPESRRAMTVAIEAIFGGISYDILTSRAAQFQRMQRIRNRGDLVVTNWPQGT